jgi:proton-dependent oligopeptide transporter, POT family
MEISGKSRQTPAFYLISFTSMWERFSYYGMRAILILYMANDIMDPEKGHLGSMQFTEGMAGIIYGFFNGACYLLPLAGGFLSDRFLGERRSIFIGGVLIMAGHFTLASSGADIPFFTGLTLLAIGNGFFKPTTVTLIGDLYEQGDKRRDSAFTIYYMIFNGGAAAAPLLCGFFGETYGYRNGFLVAGIGMALGLVIYLVLGKKYLGDLGKIARHKIAKAELAKNKTKHEPLTKVEKQRLWVIFILLFLVIAFWAAFEQAGSTLNIFTNKYINVTNQVLS